MPTFYNSNGKPYVLSVEIGRGGEGTVFYCPNDLSLVAKIYHEPIEAEKGEKLRWMAANKNDQLLKVAAWIVDTLHDNPNGRIVGFLMPNVKAKEIHELYSLKSRRIHFPEANWQFLIHAAANVARAFYNLHKSDHIMGDVNHGNCVVLADGTVKLIDCDSYSVKTDKMRYRCEVGVATHLAPELQGIDLGEVEREKKHDNFGLAVIIFQLLFLGRHPFAGNYLGAEDKSLEDCIREHRFAYGNEDITNVKQPPGTLSVSQIPLRLAIMFDRAFLTDDRPEPREWIEALEDLSKSLKQCAAHIGHHYFEELTVCPWCQIEMKTGLMLFPFISSENGISEKGFNIFTIESLLTSLDLPRNLPAKPFKPKVLPPPSWEAIELRKEKLIKFGGLATLYFFLLAFVVFIIEVQNPFFWGIVSLAWFWSMNQKLNKDNEKRLEIELQEAKVDWSSFKEEWNSNRNQNLLNSDLTLIRQKITEYQTLQKKRYEQTEDLKEKSFQYNLKLYLSAFKLEDTNIEKAQLDNLIRFGIKTAADIEENRLPSLLAIDSKIKADLLEWRKEIEKDFQFSPDNDLPEVAKNRFEIEFNESRRKVEKEIEQLLASLRAGGMTLRQYQKQMVTQAESLAQKLLQAESNAVTVGGGKVMAGILILISLLIPTVGTFSNNSSVQVAKYLPTGSGPSKYKVPPNPLQVDSVKDDENHQVNEDITDKQIAAMSALDREKSARVLHKQSLSLMQDHTSSDSQKAAERKLRLAVKFVDYYVNILYTLGNLLYDQKKYSDSVKFLEKSLLIDPENENAKLLIGENYMKMSKYEKAKEIFSAVVGKNPKSFEANYNLGKIYKNLNDYESATYRFEQATLAKPQHADAHYEYGICLYKLGYRASAEGIYGVLLKIDEEKAEKLGRIIGIKFRRIGTNIVSEQGTYVKSK